MADDNEEEAAAPNLSRAHGRCGRRRGGSGARGHEAASTGDGRGGEQAEGHGRTWRPTVMVERRRRLPRRTRRAFTSARSTTRRRRRSPGPLRELRTINRATHPLRQFTGRSKGFAYVEFEDAAAVPAAILLDNSIFWSPAVRLGGAQRRCKGKGKGAAEVEAAWPAGSTATAAGSFSSLAGRTSAATRRGHGVAATWSHEEAIAATRSSFSAPSRDRRPARSRRRCLSGHRRGSHRKSVWLLDNSTEDAPRCFASSSAA